MELKPQILFRIAILHPFFADGLGKYFSFVPSPTSLPQMTRLQARIHEYEGGSAVYGPIPASDQSSQHPVPLDMNWVFTLYSNDTDFPNYTALELPPPGQVWYANNLSGNAAPLTYIPLPLQGDRFSVNFAGLLPADPSAQRKITVAHRNGIVVQEKEYFTKPSDPMVQMDMREQPDGAYQLSVEVGAATLNYSFFKWTAGSANGLATFFEWFSCLAFQQHTPAPLDLEYTFEFQARETYWQYFLVKKNGISLRNASIRPIQFEGKKIQWQPSSDEVTLPNGLKAIEFNADGTLPLQERPEMNIQLEASGLVKGMRLPNASPELIYPAKSATERSSRIYVYL